LIEPTQPNQPRKTVLIVATVLALIAAWCYWREWLAAAMMVGACAVLLLALGLFLPVWARRFHTGWMAAARVLGYINSRVLLGLLFYGVFTPYGFVSRLLRRDPLNRRGPSQPSYWIPRARARQAKEQFERLF